ncbi:large-conductance mechanosensitive channel protein [Chitinophagaceae bacterium IBVUCB1]|nr:large-conductance mechanosensitive channel protein [Chitinophagaceae bacterium IBVUCB1]
MGFLQDFKAFAMRGNVMDLAVGVVIGGAFGKIVTAMVDDILMPIIGMATGGQKFDDKFMVLKAAKDGDVYASLSQAKEAGANVFAYGHFIQTIVDFLIIAFCIFLVVRTMARMQKKQEEAPAAPAEPSSTDKLLMEIRDALKK